MKNKFTKTFTLSLFLLANIGFSQVPNLGSTEDFVLFSSAGAVTKTGTGFAHITGNVGTNSGSSTGFGNVNGVMHDGDPASALCAADLLIAYADLDAAIPTLFPGVLLGNGTTLVPGVYSIPAPATLNLELILDGQGDPNALFIIQIEGAFSTNANSKVKLINGAKACNVFWKVEGLIDMATGTTMRGTLIANNAAINMAVGDTLEGRALSIAGAVTVDVIMAYTPIGCGSPILTGPLAPDLVSAECYTLFTTIGPCTNSGITYVVGDVGSDNGLTTGFNPLFVTGMIHTIPDGSTAACGVDVLGAYNYLNTLSYDIELLYPPQFGNNLVLTPHTYLMNGAVTFTDTLYLDAQGDPNAVFVIKIYGALSTSTYSKVILVNGTQSLNVYWMVDGAVSINDYSIFRGTIVCNNGAMSLNTGVYLDGRALTTTGALNTTAITAVMPLGCPSVSQPIIITNPLNQTVCLGDSTAFIVSATGTGLTYQWRRGNIPLIDGGNISGATNDTLIIDPVTLLDVGTDYNVIVSGMYLPSDTSSNVSLNIFSATIITTEPTDQTTCVGGTVNFSVVATGVNLTYQWRRGIVNLVNGGNISGSTTSTLTINPVSLTDAANDYNVIVSGACLSGDTSINVELIIDPSVLITVEPLDENVCAGTTVSFSVTATGTGLIYQWRKGSVNLVDGGNISGSSTSTLTINPVSLTDAANNYNVIVSNLCSSSDTSINVELIIDQTPTIITTPVDQTVCLGGTANFTITATGAGLSYQWRRGVVNLINAGNISGATSATLTINPVGITDFANNYNVVVSGTCLPNAISANVELIENTSTITLDPSDQIVCEGQAVTFTVAASGSGQTYQWMNGTTTIVNGGIISGATSTSLSINPVGTVNASTLYYVIVTGSCSAADTSAYASLTVNDCDTIDFFIPEGFSPNGDGINDVFNIRGINNYPNNSISIFNRWGNLIFEAKPYTNTWDGTTTSNFTIGNGQLPVGTYFYLLDLGNGTDMIKGTIYLNK